jgi:proteasome lid subunit RPN8/RPN11
VEITGHALEAIAAHAREAAPQECCGVLVGTASRIEEIHRSRNLDAAPAARYRLDPGTHFAAIHAARAAGKTVLGVYHSHPETKAAPSSSDLAEASYPEYVYLIAGTDGAHLYRLRDGAFVEEPLTTV